MYIYIHVLVANVVYAVQPVVHKRHQHLSAIREWERAGSRHVLHISLIHSKPAAICQVLLRKLDHFFFIFMELSFASTRIIYALSGCLITQVNIVEVQQSKVKFELGTLVLNR